MMTLVMLKTHPRKMFAIFATEKEIAIASKGNYDGLEVEVQRIWGQNKK